MKAPRELRSLVRTWQKRLGLMQWEVRLMVSPDEFGAENQSANVETDSELRIAKVTFYQSAFDETLTELVIHELLHLHCVPFKTEKGEASGDAEEHAVYAISRCLAKLATEVGE